MSTQVFKYYKKVVDLAIAKFEESRNSMLNDDLDMKEDFEFPHWIDIIEKTQSIWTSKYEGHLQISNDKPEIDNLIQKFKNDVLRIMSKKSEYAAFKKYYNHIIDHEVDLIKAQIEEVGLEQKENNNNNTETDIVNSQRKKVINFLKPVRKSTKLRKEKEEQIFKHSNIKLSHMLRCHSKKNDPNDNSTEIRDAAFEINELAGSLEEQPTFTNICATCGGNIINLIDASSDRILKRFNDEELINGSLESYNCLTWTKINGISVLACAGKHGQIKIILPKFSACLTRIDAHKSQIYQLIFHHKYPNILFSASDDHFIKVWRINMTESENKLECECQNELICTIQYQTPNTKRTKEAVLSMCFVLDDYFIFSTETNKYYVHLTDTKLFDGNKMAKSGDDQEDILSYLTTTAKKITKHSVLEAHVLSSWGRSEANLELYEDSYVSNKLFYWNNLIVSNVVDTNKLCYSKIIQEENESKDGGIELKLETVKYVDKGEEKNDIDSKTSFFKVSGPDEETLLALQPSSNAIFEYIIIDNKRIAKIACLRASVPNEYIIKNKKDLTKIAVKEYSLLGKTRVLACVFNGCFILATTNKNIVLIWQKGENKLEVEKTEPQENTC